MSVNRFTEHVLVLPEDDANRQLVNGFLLEEVSTRRIQVLEPAGGWLEVLDSFKSNHVAEMDRYPHRYMVLLIDFDGTVDRLTRAMQSIPDRLQNRVFIFGALNEPEGLKRAGLGAYEEIGLGLAKDCREQTETVWGHQQLRHNAAEIQRCNPTLRNVLFQ